MKMFIVNKLQELKDAGACWQREALGDQILADLSVMLTPDEYQAVFTARGHWITGEGRVELDQICNHLMRKYRQDTDPRTFTRTLL